METSVPTASARQSDPLRAGVCRRLVLMIPTAMVLAGLAGFAYWGHSTEWNFTSGRSRSTQKAVAPPATPSPIIRVMPDKAGRSPRIEFASKGDADAAGVGLSAAWVTSLIEQATASGEVQFDPSRIANHPARTAGVAQRVFKAPGDTVRAGELIAVIDSIELGRMKADFQQSLVQARLRLKLRDDLINAKGATSPAAIREAEAAFNLADVRLHAASQTLANLGLPVEVSEYRNLAPANVSRRMRTLGVEDAIGLGDGSTNSLPIRASTSGVVLRTDVVSGETIEAGRTLCVVVDPSRVRFVLHVSTDVAKRAAVGQRACFRPDSALREYPGIIVAIGTRADESTRTIPVWVDAENADGSLRASTLGRGRIVFREVKNALVIPTGAVHSFEGQSIAFVRDTGANAFQFRVVKTGGSDLDNVEILGGLLPGELVVESGSSRLVDALIRFNRR